MFKTIIRVCLLFLALNVSNAQAQGTRVQKAVPQNQQQMQLSFAPVVKKVAPAVVNIYTKRTVTRSVNPFMNDPFFAPFFRSNRFGRMKKQAESSLGSGVIINPDGLVVTNAHVIREADEITVVLSDGRELDATLALADEASDLALLRVKSDKPLPSASLRPSESLEVGDLVLAIGNPFGVGQTVTSGIVSAQGRSSLDINDFNFFIQTDAAINPGNSGGALVTLDGKLVGINTAIYSRDGGSLGIGFAIPSEMLASVVAAEEMGAVSNAGVIRPWLGVTTQNVSSDIGESLALDVPQGALISKLHRLSPLKEAGIKVGDVIIKMNGHIIRDSYEMKFRMATVPLGNSADVTVLRQGKEITFRVKAIAPPDDPPREETRLEGAHILDGATVANLNPSVATELGVLNDEKEAVIVLSAPRGTQSSRIVGEGDIILEVNGRGVKSVSELKAVLARAGGQGWSLMIDSNGRIRQITLR